MAYISIQPKDYFKTWLGRELQAQEELLRRWS